MKKTKAFFVLGCAFALFFATALFFAACKGPDNETGAAVISVTVSPKSTPAKQPGDTVDFVANVMVSGNISKNVRWSISEESSGDTKIEASPDDSRMATLTIGDDEDPGTINVRVESVEDDSKFDTATVTVVPKGALYNNVYLVGGASPTGWSLSSTAMTPEANNIYTWTGNLRGGSLQFAATLGAEPIDFNDGYWFVPATDGAKPSDTAQDVEFGVGQTGARNKRFRISVDGEYTIVLDAEADTVTFTAMPDAPEVEHLWMAGDATIGRWNLEWSRKMTKSGNTFTYTGMLSPPVGAFKGDFRFYITDDDTPPVVGPGNAFNLYAQLIRDADATSNPGAITGAAQPVVWIPVGSPHDTTWTVPDTAGFGRRVYKVTVDVSDFTVKVEPVAAAGDFGDSTVYAFGSATAGGWSLTAGQPMTTVDGITFTGNNVWLSAGEISFTYGNTDTLTNLNFSGPFFNPPAGQEAVTGAEQSVEFLPDGSVRNFTVATAGPYTITLNINTLKAAFTLGSAVTEVTIDPKNPPAKEPGDTVDFTANVSSVGTVNTNVTWSISGHTDTINTKITEDVSDNLKATLTISPDETDGAITVTVKSDADNLKLDTATVVVIVPDPGALFDVVYLVGGASPTGSDIVNSTPMSPGANKTFTWTGTLSPGELQFAATAIGDPIDEDDGYWFVPANNGAKPSAAAQAVNLVTGKTGLNDRSFSIVMGGTYTVVLDADAETVTFTQVPSVEHLWMIGNATIGGWRLDWSRKLEKSGNVFTLTEMLIPGEFRFYIMDSDTPPVEWSVDAQFVAPASPTIITSQAQDIAWIPPGGASVNWTMPDTPGFGRAIYKVTVDVSDFTVKVERAVGNFGNSTVYAFGPATDGGWTLTAGQPMTTFDGITFTGNISLSADEVGFTYGNADTLEHFGWSGPMFRPSSTTAVTGGEQSVEFGGGANFSVSTAGTYAVTLNINTLKATFLRTGD